MPKELDGWVDADFAGDLVSRPSSSGLVILFGKHCLKTSSSVQEPIGLSSGESEFYACVEGGAALLGMRSLMQDWGVCPKLTLKIRTDSSAAKGFSTRRGLGRQRHVSTRLKTYHKLWAVSPNSTLFILFFFEKIFPLF